jgi:hypothetical protein
MAYGNSNRSWRFKLAGYMVLLSLVGIATAQAPSTVRRDQSAVQAFAQAVNAMGGAASWAQIGDTQMTGVCSVPDSEIGGPQTNSSVRWATEGKEFRYETDTQNNGPVYLSGHGNPNIAYASGIQSLSFEYGLRRRPFHLPGLLVAKALSRDATNSLVVLGTDSIDGIKALHIRSVEYQGPTTLQASQQDWWIDIGSGLPVQVTYLLPTEDNSHYLHLTASYGGWTQLGNVLVPLQLSTTFEGQFVLQNCALQTLVTNQNPPSTFFDVR